MLFRSLTLKRIADFGLWHATEIKPKKRIKIKKYRITDRDLVLQDFVNSLNITQGQLPGRPEYGTSLWSYIFEPNVNDTKTQIEEEIRRMANADPRLIVNMVSAYPQGNGILVEVEIAVQMFTDPITLQIYFDQNNNSARLL